MAKLQIGLLVCCVIWFSSVSAASQRTELAELCLALAGQWQGDAAQPDGDVSETHIQGLCSADRQQLMLFVTSSGMAKLSQSWWFRQQGDEVLLTFYSGIDEDKQQRFSLYQHNGNYTLLGEGQRLSRPALIQLRFDKHQHGWLWRQSVMYLDDDSDQYQLFRGIDMTKMAQPK
ncbi:hypothetical protein [Shewanella waksmanii]|uniref:hypothetical protein n=1 Tax=Shewanella waksmanii TaxID=213783 RepID=UPI003735114F